MKRLLAAVVLALMSGVGVAQLVPEKAPARAEVAGTWFCISIEHTKTGLCVDDPLP